MMTKSCESSSHQPSMPPPLSSLQKQGQTSDGAEKSKFFASSEPPNKTGKTANAFVRTTHRPPFTPSLRREVVRVNEIIKPASDRRQYRALILPNHLRVLLISDPETDKAAAGMAVHVGSMTDPWARQGLAHFLEHVLFLSTEKYPEDNFLKSYVAEHSGSCNAQTLTTDTVFYFDIAPDHLGEVLHRFADLFAAPRFPADKVDRELAAIDFELEAQLADDEVRAERVRQLCGDPKHVYAKFATGNRRSLLGSEEKSEQLLTEVKNFFTAHYSADAMGLAVLGKQSLDELEQMIMDQGDGFSRLPNRGKSNASLLTGDKSNQQPAHPYFPAHCRQLIKVVPFKAFRRLVLFWPLPNTYAANALDYVVFMLSHEGPGGLLAELKRLGYCTSITVHAPFHHDFGFLNVELDLTQGITRNEEITRLLFQYLRLLRDHPQKAIYDEIKAVKDIKFHYRDTVEPRTYVFNLCFNLHISLQRAVLGRAFPPFVQEDITFVLDLLTPQALNIQVISPIFEVEAKKKKEEGGGQWKTDPVYGIQYCTERIKPELVNAWSAVELNPRLKMPELNSFIPRDFALKSEDTLLASNLYPVCISAPGARLRLWHRTDSSTYRAPKAFIGIFFRTGQLYSSPLRLDLVTLFSRLFLEHVNQRLFCGRLAGATFSLSSHRFGLELTVGGFNDRLATLALMLLTELLSFRPTPDRFEIHHGTLENELKDFGAYYARYQLNYLLETVLCSGGGWSYDEQLAAMGEATSEAMLLFLAYVFEHSPVEVLTYGNLTRKEAVDLGREVEERLWPRTSTSSGFVRPFPPMDPKTAALLMYDAYRDIELPTERVFELLVPNDYLASGHGTVLYYQVGLEEDRLKARLELFHQLITFVWFDQLRQKEQLAYVLSLNLKVTVSGTMGLTCLLQSSYPLAFVATRLQAFMGGTVPRLLGKLTAEGLQKAKASVLNRLEEKPKGLHSAATAHWGEITYGQYRFDRSEKLAEAVRAIKEPQEMLDFYNEYFKPGGPQCRRLVILLKTSRCKELASPAKNSSSDEEALVLEDPIKRVTFSNVHLLQCSTKHWPVPAVILDNFQ